MAYSIDTRKYIDKMKSFCRTQGVNIDLDNPKTIQDKLAWLNIYDEDELKVKCADKIKLHEYCMEVLGEDICTPIIKTYDKAEDIDFDELPSQFVLKCNHGSGMNIIVKDKNSLNSEDVKRRLNAWMKDNFAMRNGFEAHYNDIERKIFAEEYIGRKNETLYDYKFWCFNGQPKMYTINDGNGHGDIMYYDMKDNEMNLYQVRHHDDYIKPKRFKEMVKLAKKLSKPFKFVRVDFYEVDEKLVLGEMTFTPGAIAFKYKNPDDNVRVGKFLKL